MFKGEKVMNGNGTSYEITVFQNFLNAYPSFFVIFKDLLLIFGFFLTAHAIWLFLQAYNSRASIRGGVAGAVAEFLVGAVIIDEELVMSALHNTMSGSGGGLSFDSILAYSQNALTCFSNTNAANGISGAIQIGLSQVGVVGTVMILYGFMQMRAGYLPGGNRSLVGKGLIHVLFGYVCADMDLFYGVLTNLFGLSSTGC